MDDRTGAYNRAEGEQVRLIGIPIPAGGVGGIFDRLEGEAHEALMQARAALDQIETTISDNHGIAAGAYLKQVTSARTEADRQRMIFAAYKTIDIALARNLEPCFTPVESPESNGTGSLAGLSLLSAL